jgi:hypothetical protein
MQTGWICPICVSHGSLRMKFSKTGHWISRETTAIPEDPVKTYKIGVDLW